MLKHPQRPVGNAADAQLVRDAREEMHLSQPTIGRILWLHQPGVSSVERQLRGLTPPQRLALQTELTVRRATDSLLSIEFGPCDWREPRAAVTLREVHEAAVRHVLSCPACLAKAAEMLTESPDPDWDGRDQ
jgi:hypothetical protein